LGKRKTSTKAAQCRLIRSTECEEYESYSAIGYEAWSVSSRRFTDGFRDDILGPIYPADDLRGAEQLLRDFLVFRFGGPTVYIEQRGHPRLGMRHASPKGVVPVDESGDGRGGAA
jgi:truncated hemoglobin YjbI